MGREGGRSAPVGFVSSDVRRACGVIAGPTITATTRTNPRPRQRLALREAEDARVLQGLEHDLAAAVHAHTAETAVAQRNTRREVSARWRTFANFLRVFQYGAAV